MAKPREKQEAETRAYITRRNRQLNGKWERGTSRSKTYINPYDDLLNPQKLERDRRRTERRNKMLG